MKLIESNVEYIPQAEGLEGIYRQIELAGRVCYKSEANITEGSAKKFVDRMITNNHTSMLEHGTVYLKASLPKDEISTAESLYHLKRNPYSKYRIVDGIAYATTNFRVLIENDWLDDLKHLCKPTEHHERRYTFKLTCDRGVSHQTVRERLMSFAQESQRWCNYIKEKFGMSVTFIQPDWILGKDQAEFEEDLKYIESLYFKWINKGYTAEQARYFLINGTKTEICVTGFSSDWRHMLDLRYFEKTGKVSPDMKVLMQKLSSLMHVTGVWDDVMKYPSKFE